MLSQKDSKKEASFSEILFCKYKSAITLAPIGKPHKNPQKQNAENILSPCWGTRYLLHIYHQSNIKLSSAIRCSMHQDVGRFCAARLSAGISLEYILIMPQSSTMSMVISLLSFIFQRASRAVFHPYTRLKDRKSTRLNSSH